MAKKILSLLLYVFIFLGSLYQPWDYDLGWHLRVGKDTIEKGYPYTNTYSWELPGYHWFNSSPLLDVPRFLVYDYFGMIGISVVGALTVVLLFFFVGKLCQLNVIQKCLFFPFLWYFQDPILGQSFKGQVVSLLFLAILYTVLRAYQNRKKNVIYFLIPIFFVWANLHAQFVLGLTVFAIWSIAVITLEITTSFKSKGLKKIITQYSPLYITFVLSTLVTLINPYGFDMYNKAVLNITDPQILKTLEFIPPELYSILWWELVVWGVFLCLNTVFIVRKKSFIKYFPFLLVSILLYYLSFTARRYAWSMYVLSTPIAAFTLSYILRKESRVNIIIGYAVICASIVYLSIFDLPSRNLHNINWNSFCEITLCSPKGAEILVKMNKSKKGIGRFYIYNPWGGWLIWNYPEVKPNVDGRMSFWVDEKGNNPVRRSMLTLTLNQYQLELSPYDTYFIPNNITLNQELDMLVKRSKNWKLVFRDKSASLYTRQ